MKLHFGHFHTCVRAIESDTLVLLLSSFNPETPLILKQFRVPPRGKGRARVHTASTFGRARSIGQDQFLLG